jgi:anti-anti-sigma factor
VKADSRGLDTLRGALQRRRAPATISGDHRHHASFDAARDGTDAGGIPDYALGSGALRGALLHHQRTAVYVLDGELDRTNAEALHERLIDIAGVAEDDHLVLDMGGVTSIDGPAVGHLIQVGQALAAKGSRFELVNVPEGPMRVLRVTGLTHYLGVRT